MEGYHVHSDIYYVLNGRRYKGLDTLVKDYNHKGEGVSVVVSIRFLGVEVGTLNIDRLSAEVRRIIK